ncbi:hypothetical protein WSM22_23440 [Cytophagales bacterium WSM2-2]|nr:hypothetical protein WSM22_23440 [Cytophagales bacterium WSM2-2]
MKKNCGCDLAMFTHLSGVAIRKLPLFITLFACIDLFAQLSQPARYEHEHKGSDHEFILIPMGEKGIALVRDTEKYEDGKKTWEVILLDSALQEKFNSKITVNQRMNILGHDYRDGNVYLLFHEPENAAQNLNLTEVLADQTIKQHTIKPEVNIHFTHFSVMKGKAIFGGYISKQPALLLYDISSEVLKIVPGISESNVELMDVRVNSNDTFNALLMAGRYSAKERKLIVKTFDETGVLLVDDMIPVEEGKTIIEAITSSLIHDEMIIIGVWTYNSGKQAAGVFSVVVDPFKEQVVNYYDFAQLSHFLEYLKPKRVAKIKAKAEERRRAGKNPEFRASLSVLKIDETPNGFSFLGEAYDPSSGYNRSNSPYGYSNPYSLYNPYGFPSYNFPSRYYNPYALPYNSPPVVSDTRMLSSAVLFFDALGKLTSDYSMKLPDIKVASKEQVSDYVSHHGIITMVSKDEKEITVKAYITESDTIKEAKVKPELKNKTEVIRSETRDDSSIRAWYGRFFYVYGYHTVRNEQEKKSRDVFYINKIKAE